MLLNFKHDFLVFILSDLAALNLGKLLPTHYTWQLLSVANVMKDLIVFWSGVRAQILEIKL